MYQSNTIVSVYHMSLSTLSPGIILFFFFNDTATTEIYTLSLHDALPISIPADTDASDPPPPEAAMPVNAFTIPIDRKSTRLNSSHSQISYAVFCLKKKKQNHRSAIIRQRPTRMLFFFVQRFTTGTSLFEI